VQRLDTPPNGHVRPQTPPAPPAVPVLLLTEREAAKILAVCPKTLWQLAHDGEIPTVSIGRAKRYRVADLENFVADRAANPLPRPTRDAKKAGRAPR
jgi:excisionase family DNA binding protein